VLEPHRVRFAITIMLAAGCATDPLDVLDEPQDALDDDGDGDGKADAVCSLARCGDPAATTILFPGNPACPNGCERNLASADVYIPPRNGRPWGDTYELGTLDPTTLAGYSSGRIALLRRLALVGDGVHAVLLDPSWPDGARDFTGRGPEHGEDIVRAWLLADPARTFVLIHSRRSTGWDNYAALQHTDVGDRVKVCAVSAPHLLVPKVTDLAAALVAPDDWDNGSCSWGG
jgi:hypothetical protein